MPSGGIRSRFTAPLAVFALVLALRAASLASLLATPLASWHLWTETDEHAYVEWSARLAAGNWADVPAYRAYFNWQRDYGPPETWERWYQKNAYYAGPLYPYGLAVLRDRSSARRSCRRGCCSCSSRVSPLLLLLPQFREFRRRFS